MFIRVFIPFMSSSIPIARRIFRHPFSIRKIHPIIAHIRIEVGTLAEFRPA